MSCSVAYCLWVTVTLTSGLISRKKCVFGGICQIVTHFLLVCFLNNKVICWKELRQVSGSPICLYTTDQKAENASGYLSVSLIAGTKGNLVSYRHTKNRHNSLKNRAFRDLLSADNLCKTV